MEEPREPQDIEPFGSTIPKEQALKQLSITGFCNPATIILGKPTSDYVEANIPSDSTPKDMSFVEIGTGVGGGAKEECIPLDTDRDTRGTVGKLEIATKEGGGGQLNTLNN